MSVLETSYPLVSFVLPVHNGEKHLREAIDSVLSQTVADFELLIIDDGSTDGTRALLEEYAALDSRIRPVFNEKQGLVASLNEGIDLAYGEWIARMDADDVAMPNRLEIQLAHLKNSQADFCGGKVECFGEWFAVWHYPESHAACEARMLFGVPFAHPAVIGRRTAFAQIRYRDEFAHGEDYDFWQHAWASGYRLTNVPELVLRYRVHSHQVSSKHQGSQRSVANAVRYRHWQAVFPSLDSRVIERVVGLLDDNEAKTDLLMPVFQQLLVRYTGEAQGVLLSSFYKVFCHMAVSDFRASKNWLKLTANSSARDFRQAFGRAMTLLVLSILRPNQNGNLFRGLQRLRAKMNAK